ncbi:hypothetical protein IMCC20628_00299 [Hoeflea sp. IMCC20628]|uniref:hypothetical protein n=1 Tax=Hoeflea sp. IMCC20628 TaxID=1620421 RepID=UPI00063BDE96|nr:hypothetical protein [Hoeflea sp. IMCC20628]AKH99028.1 hypothetical protein IMCC20628_00299 [Hoeflea sp. IMCC20628]
MPMKKKSVIYTYALLAAATVLGAPIVTNAQSEAGQALGSAVRTPQGQEIPAGALGVVIVEDAREASLLQLRGIAGSGIALLRNSDGADCLSVPLRFVAGDFGGDSIAATRAKTIRLNLNDAGLVQALIAGQDIVSDQYRVGTTQDDQISIQQGLTEEHGFVLNPGKSMLADIFGADVGHVACPTF